MTDIVASWDMVKQCKTDLAMRPIVLTRKPSVYTLYERKKKIVKKLYPLYSDYIKHKYFTDKGKTVAFTLNKYRYNIDDNIDHYILWSLHELTDLMIEQTIEQFIEQLGTKVAKENIVYWVNEKEHQSVPDLWHCQIFILKT